MKCKFCNACQKGFFKSQPNKYVCIGVPEPFIIEDIDVLCTEYHGEHEENESDKVGE